MRLESLVSISDRAYKAKAFDGSEAILPKSQVFDRDWDVIKSEAYWISAWILEKKELQYSTKKTGWFNPEKNTVEPQVKIVVEKHVPEIINKKVEPIKELKR